MSVPSIYSERHDAQLYLGKQPAKPVSSDHALWSELRKPLKAAGTLPKIPASFGHCNDFPGVAWKMLGNGPQDDNSINPAWAAAQGCGDCAWAGPGHAEMESASNAKRPIPPFSSLTIVEQYAAYSGYDLETGDNDNGSDPQTVLQWRQTKGLYDDNKVVYKIGKTVSATPGDLAHLWELSYLFEDAGIGINVQQAQEDQFNSGEPWNYVPGSPIVGGHWIEVLGKWHLITWAENKQFTASFYTELNDETFAWIDPLRYSAVTGKDSEGHNDQDLELYITLVAAAKAA